MSNQIVNIVTCQKVLFLIIQIAGKIIIASVVNRTERSKSMSNTSKKRPHSYNDEIVKKIRRFSIFLLLYRLLIIIL